MKNNKGYMVELVRTDDKMNPNEKHPGMAEEDESFFVRTDREHSEHLSYARKKYGEFMDRETLEEYLKNEDPAPRLEMFLGGKEVFPDSRHYDAYSSITGAGILQYANGKPAGHTNSGELRFRLY